VKATDPTRVRAVSREKEEAPVRVRDNRKKLKKVQQKSSSDLN
jgi:hypothetical protein